MGQQKSMTKSGGIQAELGVPESGPYLPSQPLLLHITSNIPYISIFDSLLLLEQTMCHTLTASTIYNTFDHLVNS